VLADGSLVYSAGTARLVIRSLEFCSLRRASFVTMVEATNLGNLRDVSPFWGLDGYVVRERL
jgi:hypothetical protein